MTFSNLVLVDANVIIYAHQALSEFHAESKAILEKGRKGELPLCVCPQVLNEFYAVVTSSRRVSKPASSEDARTEIEKFYNAKHIEKIYPIDLTGKIILDLLKLHKVKSHDIFDLYLVATMLSNNIRKIYTFNEDDFSRFSGIEVLIP